ncbi:molecular chaperone GrpE [Geomicrobium halophilum]|uniref:Protein GrpE n=1 Tax=Geomicrobium halophilum TaxID=549000 RepID=A0A841PJ58_9BACL|nr:nucleotide exchange factor GrpE [Geomicrobium halophilum]MBB6448820.1 molecular chaperone GrpE [Geomicrobium halophilum]
MNEKENTEHVEEEVEILNPEEDSVSPGEHQVAESVDEDQEQDTAEEALRNELEEWRTKAHRIQADYDNFRKRSRAEKEAAAQYRAQPLMESLLPVLDNFSRALDSEAEDSSSLYKGMEMVYKQFHEALESEGLEEIKTEGETFDPSVHQAVMQVEEEGFESGQIVEELQKGYKLKTRVLRPAMVKVNA